jgi:hypothetical protein
MRINIGIEELLTRSTGTTAAATTTGFQTFFTVLIKNFFLLWIR